MVESGNKNAKEKEKEKGYEALIKPIQDVIAKDWKVRLCNYLDIYIEHLHEPGTVFINFTEAALLVQNTSTYYCKRVDLMYNWVRQFCFSLAEKFMEVTAEDGQTSSTEKPPEQKTNQKKTTKKNKNLLHSDELELLKYTHTEHKSINFKLEKINGNEIRQVILNSNMKTQTKPGSCIPVNQSESEEMGFKDEFRLHWKIAHDGRLYEDFRYDATQGISASMYAPASAPITSPQLNGGDLNESEDLGMDDNFNDGMDIEPISPPHTNMSGSEHLADVVPEHRGSEGSNLMASHLPEEFTDIQKKEIKKAEENFYTVIPFASLIMHRKFKKRQVFKLPKELIEEVAEMRSKQKKNGKADEHGKVMESDYNYHLSFSEILGGKSEDMIQHKLGKRKSARLAKRKKRNQQQPTDNNNLENAADLNNDTADDDHDFDDFADLAEPLPPLQGDSDEAESVNQNFENAYEASAKLIGEMFQLKNDPLSITKRVAAWHKMIQPVLAEAEKRSVFSVNEYGTRILDNFKDVGEVKPFTDLVASQPREEICRYFLSTLMLANTYNLEIKKTSDEELAKDCLQLKLLSKVRHHEELDANVGATTANGPLL